MSSLLPDDGGPAMTVQAIPTEVPATLRPLRFNFAQVCIWCEHRWCESAECIGKHERSLWVVCDLCDGFTWCGPTEPCTCFHGLVEATPDSAALAGRELPDHPAWYDDPALGADDGGAGGAVMVRPGVRVTARKWAN